MQEGGRRLFLEAATASPARGPDGDVQPNLRQTLQSESNLTQTLQLELNSPAQGSFRCRCPTQFEINQTCVALRSIGGWHISDN